MLRAYSPLLVADWLTRTRKVPSWKISNFLEASSLLMPPTNLDEWIRSVRRTTTRRITICRPITERGGVTGLPNNECIVNIKMRITKIPTCRKWNEIRINRTTGRISIRDMLTRWNKAAKHAKTKLTKQDEQSQIWTATKHKQKIRTKPDLNCN